MIGNRFAHYEITGHLGTGGMGEVYQAADSKLGRSVAIKFLPEAFTHDNERVGFLFNAAPHQQTAAPLTLIQNWLAALKK